MHGATHDWVVLNTIKNGLDMPSGEEHNSRAIREYISYPFEALTEQRLFKRVLEVGSLNVNGSTKSYDFMGLAEPWLRLIGNPQYMGIDLEEGKDVDIVMNAHDMSIFVDGFFDLVICVNTLEHDDDIAKTLSEMWRVTESGGVIIISVPNEEVPKHHSEHYNYLTTEVMQGLLKDAGFKDYIYHRTYHDHLIKAIK